MNIHKDPEFYNDDPDLPVFEQTASLLPTRSVYTLWRISYESYYINLQTFVIGEFLHQYPCASFVIDLNSLDNKDDILSNDLGVVNQEPMSAALRHS